MIYLCIPHKNHPWIYAARWLVLAGITWFQWHTVWETSSESPAVAILAGLTGSWGVVWSVVWLVLRRPQWEATRVQRRRTCTLSPGKGRSEGSGHKLNATEFDGSKERQATYDEGLKKTISGILRRRELSNGHAREAVDGHLETNGGSHTSGNRYANSEESTITSKYFWQSYPEDFTERRYWVADLTMNFRGPGWNWAIPPLPDLPDFVKEGLGESVKKPSKGVSSTGLKQYTTRQELFHGQVPRFVVGYFALDVLKTIMMKDPYYIFGPTTYALPSHLTSLSPVQIQIYRVLLGVSAMIVSLQMALSLVPLTVGLLLGPGVFGQRAEPWYFPTTWGSFSNITDQGLNGLWGGWWHQTFRFAFAAPSNFLIDNGYIKPRSTGAKIAALLFAFGISGLIHSAGSITQVPKTYPLQAPIFFMLQALGIFLQNTFCSLFKSHIKKLPKAARQIGNLLFTLTWGLSTGWILADDFSRGGIWLYEPIPISPLRGLGFGVEGDRWWCWEHGGVGWYTGKHWWQSGIAL